MKRIALVLLLHALGIPVASAQSVTITRDSLFAVFPPNLRADSAWASRGISSPFAGPYWSVIVPTAKVWLTAAAHMAPFDDRVLPAFDSLAAVIAATRVSECHHGGWIYACGAPLNGSAMVADSSVHLAIKLPREWRKLISSERPQVATLWISIAPDGWSWNVPIRDCRTDPCTMLAPGDPASLAALIPPHPEGKPRALLTACGRLIIAVGDSIKCLAMRAWCRFDVCDAPEAVPPRIASWKSSRRKVVSTDGGILVARKPGMSRISVKVDKGKVSYEVQVVGPVDSLYFEQPTYHIRVGDTLMARAWVRDSLGVSTPLFIRAGNTGLGYAGSEGRFVRFVGLNPGTTTLVAWMANHSTAAEVVVAP